MSVIYNPNLAKGSVIVFKTSQGDITVPAVTESVVKVNYWRQVTTATLREFEGTVDSIEVYFSGEIVSMHKMAARGFTFNMFKGDELAVTSDFEFKDERGRYSVKG